MFTKWILTGNNVVYKSFYTNGLPYIMVARGGKFSIGENFAMNNGIKGNPIGCYERCTFFVDRGAVLTIGDSVGMSQAALVCHKSITIGDNVKIGGGVCIYDTDFHSLDPIIRRSREDLKNRAEKLHSSLYLFIILRLLQLLRCFLLQLLLFVLQLRNFLLVFLQ